MAEYAVLKMNHYQVQVENFYPKRISFINLRRKTSLGKPTWETYVGNLRFPLGRGVYPQCDNSLKQDLIYIAICDKKQQ
jgi:hypothetical protein